MSKLAPRFINQILCCDCVAGMRDLPDGCIPLTVTSRAIDGRPFDFEGIARQLFRVTAPGGVLCWVVQDQVVDGSFAGGKHRQVLFFQELGLRVQDEITLDSGGLTLNVRYTCCVLSKGRPRTVYPPSGKPNATTGKSKDKRNTRNGDGTMRVDHRGKSTQERGHVWASHDAESHLAMPERMTEDLILSLAIWFWTRWRGRQRRARWHC